MSMTNLKRFCALLPLLLMPALILSSCGKNKEVQEPETTAEPETFYFDKTLNPLTGEGGYDEKYFGARPVIVMINNAPQARPQWGLCDPEIVFETLVEGGATRMAYMYANPDAVSEKIGPIRSARHDFVELANGYGAFFVHWGYSPQAKQLIADIGLHNINGLIYDGKYFFRDKERKTAIEHRGYSTNKHINQAIADFNYPMEIRDECSHPFRFAGENEPRVLNGGPCESITVTFSSRYKHTFKYSADDNLYYNFMNDDAMYDDKGVHMSVRNVIALYTEITDIDDVGRVDINLTEGHGIYVSRGKAEEITWKKTAADLPLKFYGKDGKDLVLNAGKSWVGIAPLKSENLTEIK